MVLLHVDSETLLVMSGWSEASYDLIGLVGHLSSTSSVSTVWVEEASYNLIGGTLVLHQ